MGETRGGEPFGLGVYPQGVAPRRVDHVLHRAPNTEQLRPTRTLFPLASATPLRGQYEAKTPPRDATGPNRSGVHCLSGRKARTPERIGPSFMGSAVACWARRGVNLRAEHAQRGARSLGHTPRSRERHNAYENLLRGDRNSVWMRSGGGLQPTRPDGSGSRTQLLSRATT